MRIMLLAIALPSIALAQAGVVGPDSRASAPKSPEDKVVCKTSTATGSLIAAHKECKTRREWDAESSAYQRQLSDCTAGAGATGARC